MLLPAVLVTEESIRLPNGKEGSDVKYGFISRKEKAKWIIILLENMTLFWTKNIDYCIISRLCQKFE